MLISSGAQSAKTAQSLPTLKPANPTEPHRDSQGAASQLAPTVRFLIRKGLFVADYTKLLTRADFAVGELYLRGERERARLLSDRIERHRRDRMRLTSVTALVLVAAVVSAVLSNLVVALACAAMSAPAVVAAVRVNRRLNATIEKTRRNGLLTHDRTEELHHGVDTYGGMANLPAAIVGSDISTVHELLLAYFLENNVDPATREVVEVLNSDGFAGTLSELIETAKRLNQ